MRILFDWKFVLTLLLTAASVLIPVWLWQAELSSKSLKLDILSVVEIQPKGLGKLEGLQMSIDGKPMENLYISVLELSNSGTKPILTSDFEGLLKIAINSPSAVVKAQIELTTPTSIDPKINVNESVIFVQPLLLNPGDVIRLSIISANSRPEFSVQGRIAGISRITKISTSERLTSEAVVTKWVSKFIAVMLFVIYTINITDIVVASHHKKPFLPFKLVTGFISVIGGTLLAAPQAPFDSGLMLPYAGLGALIGVPIALYRRNKVFLIN